MCSHPYYTRLLDGMSIPGSTSTSRPASGSSGPATMPLAAYDVDQVKLEYRMSGRPDDWTTIGILTAYDDTVCLGRLDFWVGYEFVWDTVDLQRRRPDRPQGHGDGRRGQRRTVQIVRSRLRPRPRFSRLSIPEAQDVCGENRVKGVFNIIATEMKARTRSTPTTCRYMYQEASTIRISATATRSTTTVGSCGADTLMLEGGTTSETIWRGVIDPDRLDGPRRPDAGLRYDGRRLRHRARHDRCRRQLELGHERRLVR